MFSSNGKMVKEKKRYKPFRGRKLNCWSCKHFR